MVHGTVKGLLGLISTLVLVALLAMAGAAYRLSLGPVSLSFLNPSIEQALTQVAGGNLAVTLEDTVLAWDGQAETLTIHLHNVHAASLDGHGAATLPDATVSLAGAPLLVGRVAVRGVRVLHPKLRLLRTASGAFALGLGDVGDADTAALLDRAIGGDLTGGGGTGVARQGDLREIEIVGGDLDFDDKALDMSWHAPQVDLHLVRTATGVQGSAGGPLMVGNQAARIELSGLYSDASGAVNGSLRWSGIRPAYFARLFPALAPLPRLQFTTNGTADFTYGASQGFTDLTFDLSGGAGAIDLSPWLPNPLKVAAVALKGRAADAMNALSIEELRLDLGGPKLVASAKATGIATAPHIEGELRVEEMPVDTAKTLWPAEVAANARSWIVANISGGTVRQGDLKIALALPAAGAKPSAGLQVETMSGALRGEGMAIHYFGALPSARGVSADATFDENSFTATIKSGVAGGVEVVDGNVKLAGFNDPEQTASIKLDLNADVRDALRLIDTKPLGYASAVGFDPERAKGDANVALEVELPLVKTLRMAQVKLHARAHTKALAIPKAAFGLDLSDGALDLDVDPRGMDVTGKAVLGGIPIDLNWRESFAATHNSSQYHVKATLNDAARRAIGLDDPALQAPVLGGAILVEMDAALDDDKSGDVDVSADLGPAELRFPGLNYSKPRGVAGALKARVHVTKGSIVAVQHFEVSAVGGMQLLGDIAFDPGNHPRRISLTTAKWGRSDFRTTIVFKPENEIHIAVEGASFDASELVGGGSGVQHLEENQKLTLEAKRIARVWLSDDGSMQSVDANMTHSGGQWNEIRVNAIVGQGRAFHFEVKPASEQSRRTLRALCDDAGSVFGAFGILKTMRGGTMTIDGTYLDSYPGKPLEAVLHLTDYRVVKAPLLARIMTVAALTGAGDVLSGEGIHFKRAEIHFNLVNDLVTLKDARASGNEIGLTAKGQIDLNSDRLALAGTIVPAYAINSAFGEIPVIGSLLTGGKGGGLIAFNYTVNGQAGDPDVTVNPLSALTPGFLRGLFGIFDDSDGPKVTPPTRSGGQAPPSGSRSND